MIIREQDIGGAVVRRLFRRGLDTMHSGERMTRDEVLALPRNNLQALSDNGYIDIYPPSAERLPSPVVETQRFVASRGFAKFDVYEGRKVNDAPLTKAEAMALAGEADPDDVPGQDAPTPEPAAN